MTAQLVIRRDIGAVSVLTLNRPDKLNALSPEVFDTLAAHLDALDAAPPGCLVLAGAGRSFCAGADTAALQARVVTEDPEFRSRTMQRLGDLSCPVIAAVQGHCLTGGLELALTADIIVAADTARFRDGHAPHGILPRWGLSARLPRRIGLAAARRMAWTAEELPAAEALRIGLCDHVVEASGLEAFTLDLAARIAGNATAAGIKRLYSRALTLSLEEALENERASSRPGGGSGRDD